MPRIATDRSAPIIRNMTDLILQGGDIRGRQALQSGSVWGGAIQNLGQILGQGTQNYFGMRKEEQAAEAERLAEEQQAERDAQLYAYLRDKGADFDPAKIIEIVGDPERGIKIAEGYQGLFEFRNDLEEGRRKEAVGRLPKMVAAIDALGGPESPLGAEAIGALIEVLNQSGLTPGITWDLQRVVTEWDAVRSIVMDPEKLHKVFVTGPEGEKIATLKPESEMREGVPVYTEPEDPLERRETEARIAKIEAETAKLQEPPEPEPPEPLEAAPSEWRNVVRRATLGDPKRTGNLSVLVDDLIQAGDTEQAAEVIRQATIEGELADDRRQITGRRQTVAALRDIADMLVELEELGIDTGPLKSGWETGLRKIGQTTDPKVAELVTRLNSTRTLYRRAMTGVAFNPQEAAEYDKLFPDYGSEPPTNAAVIRGLIRSMQSNDQEYWERKLGKRGAALVNALDPAQYALPSRPSETKGRQKPKRKDSLGLFTKGEDAEGDSLGLWEN